MAPSTLSKLCSPSLPDRRDGFAEDNVFLEENWNIHCLITAPLLWLSVGSSREREEGNPAHKTLIRFQICFLPLVSLSSLRSLKIKISILSATMIPS